MSGATSNQPTALAVCAFELNAGDGEVQLLPVGDFRAIDGRPAECDAWHIDSDVAGQVIDRFNARKNRAVIDYEHQTLHTRENGKPAPAAGWFDRLVWRDDSGLFAAASWTERAQEHIRKGEYKYLSAVFPYHPKTGEVLDIYMAGLTNHPGIDGMEELLAAATAVFKPSTQEDHTVKPTQLNIALAALLGLATGASDEDIQQAVVALKSTADEAKAAGEKVAALTADLEQANQKLAATGGEPDPSQYVKVEVMQDLQAQVASLSAKLTEGEVHDLVEVALADGRLLPKQADWARSLGRKDLAELKTYLDHTQPIAALTGTQTRGKQPKDESGDPVLTDQQLAVCKAMNIDPEDYKKELATKVA